jgi:hypothetical protein
MTLKSPPQQPYKPIHQNQEKLFCTGEYEALRRANTALLGLIKVPVNSFLSEVDSSEKNSVCI